MSKRQVARRARVQAFWLAKLHNASTPLAAADVAYDHLRADIGRLPEALRAAAYREAASRLNALRVELRTVSTAPGGAPTPRRARARARD